MELFSAVGLVNDGGLAVCGLLNIGRLVDINGRLVDVNGRLVEINGRLDDIAGLVTICGFVSVDG